MKRNKIKIVVEMLVILAMLSVVSASTMAAEVPGVPRGFDVISGDESVYLAWSEPAYDGGSAITGYRIYRGIMEDGLGIVEDVIEMSYTDTGLQNGQPYYYAVSALNAEGEGEKTEVLSATPEAVEESMPTIVVGDWTSLATIYVGEGVYLDIAGGTHTLIVESVTSTSTLMSISWGTQSLTMSKGDSENVDVNSDGKDDLKITCVTITSEPAEGFPQTVEFSFTKKLGGGTPGFELGTLVVASLVVFSVVSVLRRRKSE